MIRNHNHGNCWKLISILVCFWLGMFRGLFLSWRGCWLEVRPILRFGQRFWRMLCPLKAWRRPWMAFWRRSRITLLPILTAVSLLWEHWAMHSLPQKPTKYSFPSWLLLSLTSTTLKRNWIISKWQKEPLMLWPNSHLMKRIRNRRIRLQISCWLSILHHLADSLRMMNSMWLWNSWISCYRWSKNPLSKSPRTSRHWWRIQARTSWSTLPQPSQSTTNNTSNPCQP